MTAAGSSGPGRPPDGAAPAPGGGTSPGGFRRFDHRALGTLNTILIAEPDPARPELADRAGASAIGLIDRIEAELSRFIPESDVSLLNALGADGPVPVGRTLREVLALSRRAWEETGGAFDPTLGPLLDAWGFPRGPARVPPAAEIEALLDRRGMDRVIIDDEARTVRFDRPGMRIDLGAIGKGYAVDRAAALLQERGVPAGTVNSGNSSIALWGRPPEGGPWTMEVTHPRHPEQAFGTLSVEPGTVSTSGAYEEGFAIDGIEYGHILDPRTGRPVRSATRSVTVWAAEAAWGDMLSTALFVLDGEGRERLLGRLRARGMRISALVLEDDPGVPGGLRALELHSGEPAFRREIEGGRCGD